MDAVTRAVESKAAARIRDLKERNGKLERALIEATIK